MLQGEHGTGRNVAPYVEMEWGTTAYELMWQLKELFDPNYVLNPGVILNAVSISLSYAPVSGFLVVQYPPSTFSQAHALWQGVCLPLLQDFQVWAAHQALQCSLQINAPCCIVV